MIKNASQFNEYLLKNYNKDTDEWYLLEFDVQYSKQLHDLFNDLQFPPERMKTEKIEKLVLNLLDKKEYVMQIKNWSSSLN